MGKKRSHSDRRQRNPPGVNGWSVFTVSATVPTFVCGSMAGTSIQFTPYMESIEKTPGMALQTFYSTAKTLRWLRFASYDSASTLDTYRTYNDLEITDVTMALTEYPTSSGQYPQGGHGITVSKTATSVDHKETKCTFLILSTMTLATTSEECAIGRF